jgi:hypothetical protein
MVARMLSLCGLDLGPEADMLPPQPDNEEGFYENRRFVAVSDAVLDALGGAWDTPPVFGADWESLPAVAAARTEAEELIATFHSAPQWGWKDPRVALLLPFWRRVVPALRLVVCVRHPVDVAASLTRRHSGLSQTFGLRLWAAYTAGCLRDTQPEERVVTHYDTYFHDPAAELRRVTMAVGLDPDPAQLIAAASAAATRLRHHTGTRRLPAAHVASYQSLCTEAGEVAAAAFAVPEAPSASVPLPPLPAMVDWLHQRLGAYDAALRNKDAAIADLHADINRLLAAGMERESALRDREHDIAALTAEVARRDDTATAQEQELTRIHAALEAATADRDDLRARLEWIEAHPLWRLALRRRLRSRPKSTGR